MPQAFFAPKQASSGIANWRRVCCRTTKLAAIHLDWQHEKDCSHIRHDRRPGDDALAGIDTRVHGIRHELRRLSDRRIPLGGRGEPRARDRCCCLSEGASARGRLRVTGRALSSTPNAPMRRIDQHRFVSPDVEPQRAPLAARKLPCADANLADRPQLQIAVFGRD